MLARFILATSVEALQVSPGSPCSSACLDSPISNASNAHASNTIGADITCFDKDYTNTTKGQKFVSCVNCLETSTASGRGESDQDWFLYNLRYTLVTCLFGFSNASDAKATVCSTSKSCGPLQPALEEDNLNVTTESKYGYCTASDVVFRGPFLDSCETCLANTDDQKYLRNFLAVLNTGCDQRSGASLNIGFQGSIFSTTQINGAWPGYSQHPLTSTSQRKRSLSQGGIVGIAVGSIAFAGTLVTMLFLCFRKQREKRRRKAMTSTLDERYGASNITSPISGAYGSPYLPSPPIKSVDQHNPAKIYSKDWGMPKIDRSRISHPIPYSQELQYADYWQDKTDSRSANLSPSPPPSYFSPQMPTHQAYVPKPIPLSPQSTTATARTSSNYSVSNHASPRSPLSAQSSPIYAEAQQSGATQRPGMGPAGPQTHLSSLSSTFPNGQGRKSSRVTRAVGVGNVNASMEMPTETHGPTVRHGERFDIGQAVRERLEMRGDLGAKQGFPTLEKDELLTESSDNDEQWPGSY